MGRAQRRPEHLPRLRLPEALVAARQQAPAQAHVGTTRRPHQGRRVAGRSRPRRPDPRPDDRIRPSRFAPGGSRASRACGRAIRPRRPRRPASPTAPPATTDAPAESKASAVSLRPLRVSSHASARRVFFLHREEVELALLEVVSEHRLDRLAQRLHLRVGLRHRLGHELRCRLDHLRDGTAHVAQQRLVLCAGCLRRGRRHGRGGAPPEHHRPPASKPLSKL